MAETYIFCNLANCRKKLHHLAFVTTCKHIFCLKHLQGDALKENRHTCLACGNQLQTKSDIVQVNLSPNEQYKAMVLIGLNPEQIMEIATRAINFFVYQINYDKRNKDDTIGYLKEQINQAKSYYEPMIAKYKSELHYHQRNLEKAKDDIKEKMRLIELQQQEIVECRKQLKQMQKQSESYKEKLLCAPPIVPSRRHDYNAFTGNNHRPYSETIATSQVFPHYNHNIDYQNDPIFQQAAPSTRYSD